MTIKGKNRPAFPMMESENNDQEFKANQYCLFTGLWEKVKEV